MGRVVSVSRDPGHHFSKPVVPEIRLLAGLGVEGDAHAGSTVKHRSRVRVDPTQPNLRQVHLLHHELFDELQAKGFAVAPGDLGENVVVEGIDLLALPVDTELHLGQEAVVRLTGLRNPCAQIENFKKGLLEAVLDRDADGGLIRKAGVMSVVVTGGVVRVGDGVKVVKPPLPHRAMERV
ncbi:MOSC domain-containing protein [Devosia sp.]|uniref:MOSC domain-containing protein n=1 Tax=Devosia sp. TaxID=1871048 RepID=UPI002B003DB9|nr:MOSC domain-containing protein [Devosia sp.]